MRADDLEKLVEIRGGMPEGKRMICLFWQMNFMCIAGRVTEENFDAMASLLATKIDPNWDFRIGDLVTVRMNAFGLTESLRAFNASSCTPQKQRS